ncbi:GNAT superfamily N-acetyltransferase [Thermocatellispora tengchongensis]|uniref:GNAT superfamily N-acetyltransferase n=1 Tax=Thermocatellispora tengchongensis TaxID=1073253 RepID=A0A840PDG8_9ACTN|nr:GNAT family N-acetyltransferase [Thermocatellispora tengchongensis]MBB5135207.1 GNAT superfamily N-acetyltransferase [Thermocatellispora tengchongensis]
MDVTTWHLEQTDPADLIPAKPPRMQVDVVRSEVPSPEFARFLYTAVGGDWHWTTRLPWTRRQWLAWLDRPGLETWVAWHRGTPAGYVQLESQPDGVVEITNFGLLPYAIGHGVGGHLLHAGASRAWDIHLRWPGREPTRRVWVHTCSLDGPAALSNYKARGFRLFKTEVKQEDVADTPPGPWPGA